MHKSNQYIFQYFGFKGLDPFYKNLVIGFPRLILLTFNLPMSYHDDLFNIYYIFIYI